MYHYVYQITNMLNNKIYVGKRSSKAHPDIDKYISLGFIFGRLKESRIHFVETTQD